MDVDVNKKFRGRERHAGKIGEILRREGAYVMKRIRDMAETAECPPLVEFSGGQGVSFLVHHGSPHSGRAGQQDGLNPIREALYRDLSAFSLEVFPKQESLSGKGMGNPGEACPWGCIG